MPAREPVVASDSDTWGSLLNAFLSAGHNADGTHPPMVPAAHATSHIASGSDVLALDQAHSHSSPDTDAATGSLHHTVGAGATQAAAGNHTHAGTTPSAHAATHQTGGTDVVTLDQVHTHNLPDTDAGVTSLHHTVGAGANQAAAGNHTHGAPGTLTVVTKTGSYTALATDDLILMDATAGPITLTLIDASTRTRPYYIVKIDVSANPVTVACTGAQTISGLSTAILAYQFAPLIALSNQVSAYMAFPN